MERMKDLNDLLHHEIQDLYSAEEQILAALPKMIQKTNSPELRSALEMHLRVTEEQRNRLDKVKQLMSGGNSGTQKKGALSGLFGKKDKCLGMEGIIREGEKIMGENMSPEVTDAAILACAQKVEHYEICGYGTARAYARELGMGEVAELLEETLDEEYEADDRLTDLAVGRLNEEAKSGGGSSGGSGSFAMEREEAGEMALVSNPRGAGNGKGNARSTATGSRGSATGTGNSSAKGARSGATGAARSTGMDSGSTGRSTTGSAASKASSGSKAPAASRAGSARTGATTSNARTAGTGGGRTGAAGKGAASKSTTAGKGAAGKGSTGGRTSGNGSSGGRASGNTGRGNSRGR